MLKVKKSSLLVIAGLVWLSAGINILRIGVKSLGTVMQQGRTGRVVWLLLAALVVLVGFCFMFRKIVEKHSSRIMGYKEEKKPVWYFFAAFYTGLGSALSFSGIRFLTAWSKFRR